MRSSRNLTPVIEAAYAISPRPGGKRSEMAAIATPSVLGPFPVVLQPFRVRQQMILVEDCTP
jgi:hypothetical protein